jgi:hypothetical protein
MMVQSLISHTSLEIPDLSPASTDTRSVDSVPPLSFRTPYHLRTTTCTPNIRQARPDGASLSRPITRASGAGQAPAVGGNLEEEARRDKRDLGLRLPVALLAPGLDLRKLFWRRKRALLARRDTASHVSQTHWRLTLHLSPRDETALQLARQRQLRSRRYVS